MRLHPVGVRWKFPERPYNKGARQRTENLRV